METWHINYDDWDEKEELLRESLCTLGNGYFAVRGAAEESEAGECHYPGTYLAGGYNRLKTKIKDHEIENEDLVNWPNWLCLTFRHGDGEWFDVCKVDHIGYYQKLDLKDGELKRHIHFKDKAGRETILETRRLVSMDNQHIGALRWEIKPINWSGPIEVKSYIDGSVVNWGVKRYRELNSLHLQPKSRRRINNNSILLETSTTTSEIVMAQAVRTQIFFKNKPQVSEFSYWEDETIVGNSTIIHCEKNSKIEIEKVVCIFTSRDKAIHNPAHEAEKLLERCPGYKQLLCNHKDHWERIWDLCDIQLARNSRETKLLRFHIFHLLQTVSFKSIDLDVSVPSRGLHGEAYRGHIFWDEIYILPYLNLRIPEINRSLLMYRYRRLEEARANARCEGHKGAMFPWQSGSDGKEESQVLHLNPESGHWIPDNTYKQRHINATIVFNIWKYYQATDDNEFLSFFGIEMALEISRFWASIMVFNESRGRYDIKGVVGPDEFHTKYSDRMELGIDNNAYTNFMASWCLRITLKMFHSLVQERKDELLQILKLTKRDLDSWEEMSKKVFIPIQEDGIIDQFEGFNKLLDLDWAHYKNKYGNIQRIDRILESEGDNVNCYKVNKQADVLMLYYLFTPDELTDGFAWLGIPFDVASIPKNIKYHISLSTNGSSLSRIVHTWVLARYDSAKSWLWFQRALESDITDIQGGTTAEGIHLGAMAGTVDLVQRCFTGIEVINDVLWVNPHIPDEIQHLEFSIRLRGQSLHISLVNKCFTIKVQRTSKPSVKIGHEGRVHNLKQGEEYTFEVFTPENVFNAVGI
jgi:trehalose/maltose hydrolase-like predicted phosphorylase